MSAVIKEHSTGLLKSGKKFEVIHFKALAVADDGSIHSGVVGVVVDGKYLEVCVSMLAEQIDYRTARKSPRFSHGECQAHYNAQKEEM